VKRAAPERAIQSAIRQRLIFHGVVCIAIPNAAKRSPGMARAMKAEGLMAGAPDLVCVGDHGRVAWLEVKAPRGVVSDAQASVHELLRRKGHLVAVVRSQDEAADTLRAAGWFA
jgi:hypothetical protein